MKRPYFNILVTAGVCLLLLNQSCSTQKGTVSSKTATVSNGYTMLNPQEAIKIYKYEELDPSGKVAGNYEPKYYFTTASSDDLILLNKANLKKAFSTNYAYLDAIDANFSTDEELIMYDDVHKMYKINRLLLNDSELKNMNRDSSIKNWDSSMKNRDSVNHKNWDSSMKNRDSVNHKNWDSSMKNRDSVNHKNWDSSMKNRDSVNHKNWDSSMKNRDSVNHKNWDSSMKNRDSVNHKNWDSSMKNRDSVNHKNWDSSMKNRDSVNHKNWDSAKNMNRDSANKNWDNTHNMNRDSIKNWDNAKNMNTDSSLMSSMNSSMEKMKNMKMSADVDHDFAHMMIIHHQAAIDMSEVVMDKGIDAQVRKMAQRIITENKVDIAQLELFIKNHKVTEGEMQNHLGESMKSMMAKMNNMKMTGNIDKDYVMMMIPHHEYAVALAEAQLAHGKQIELKKIAQTIISGQKKEIAEFNSWKSIQK